MLMQRMLPKNCINKHVHSSHDDSRVKLLLRCGEANAILLCVPDGVIFAQEGIAQNPNRHASVHSLDAEPALLFARVVFSADYIEVWAEVEVFAAQGDGDYGQ